MKKTLGIIISCVIITAINTYFRSFPINFPQLRSEARAIAERQALDEVKKDIDKKFPEYDNLAKTGLIQEYVRQYKREGSFKINKQVEEEYLKLKDPYQDDSGQTYLMELDCWHWARYVQNVLMLGHPGDKVVDGRQFDTLMVAPLGSIMPWNHFLFYMSAFLYQMFSFAVKVPLFKFLFYLPLVFSAIFIVVLYLFCVYGWNTRVAIFAALFAGLAPIILGRTGAGWFDIDTLNLLFPLVIVWFHALFYSVKSFWHKLIFILLSSFLMGLFSFTWANWWFIFFIIIIYELYSLLNIASEYLQYRTNKLNLFKQHLFGMVLFVILSVVWILILSGKQPFKDIYNQVVNALVLNQSITSSIWPNVFATVGELTKVDIIRLVTSVGGLSLFISGLIAIFLAFLTTSRSSKVTLFQRESIVMFTMWFMVMFFACLKGIRFSIFIVVPIGVCLGFMLDRFFTYLQKKRRPFGSIIMIVIVFLFSFRVVSNAYAVAVSTYPFMNDAWYKGLMILNKETPKEAIINTWWDFGDWIKAVSKRRVIFDGQSQSVPQSYWIAKVLMSDNEEEAITILRMLNNGGNNAFEIINSCMENDMRSLVTVKKVMQDEAKITDIKKRNSEIKTKLANLFPKDTADSLSKIFLSKPGKAYFIIDPTMEYKLGAFSYIGNWDFIKYYISQNLQRPDSSREILFEKSGVDKKDLDRYYKEACLISGSDLDLWISPRMGFYTGLAKGDIKDEIVYFDNNVVYNPKKKTVYMYNANSGKYGVPEKLFLFRGKDFEEIKFPKNDAGFSVLIFKKEEAYFCIIMDEKLVKSLFVRLYFLDGKGLKYFKLFKEVKHSFKIFEILWEQ